MGNTSVANYQGFLGNGSFLLPTASSVYVAPFRPRCSLRWSPLSFPGLLGWMPSHAVTFLDNHDTGSTQAHWCGSPEGSCEPCAGERAAE